METQPASRSVGGEQRPGRNQSSLPRPSTGMSAFRSASVGRGNDENNVPRALAPGLQGMLRTGTETGDIGQFSVRPSRVPQSVNTPRRIASSRDLKLHKPSPSSQPCGAPLVDDRVRLPSYARDPTSEIISMYENDSQKLVARIYEEADHRSYSMTQASLHRASINELSNHRSYTSLRSQRAASNNVPRPKSPYAYPTRLRRPGFRPSSPALTDGGAIDYRHRTETDRTTNGLNTSYPAPVHGPKRRPSAPILLRTEVNRSTSSLFSQASSARQPISPQMRTGNETPCYGWTRRTGQASVNSSPARSTLSVASTTNPPHSGAILTTTTPGWLAPPSPRYYDYTEEFDIDDYNPPESSEPPPAFRIERTIPEDRPLSSDTSSITTMELLSLKEHVLPDGLQPFLDRIPRSKSSRHASGTKDLRSIETEATFETILSKTEAELCHDADIVNGIAAGDRKSIQPPHLASRPQGLHSDVERPCGLANGSAGRTTCSESSNTLKNEIPFSNLIDESFSEQHDNHDESSFSLTSLQFSQFPAPPINIIQGLDLAVTKKHRGSLNDLSGFDFRFPPSEDTPSCLSKDLRRSSVPNAKTLPTRASTTYSKTSRSSKVYSIDKSLMDLAELIKTFETTDTVGHIIKPKRKATPMDVLTSLSFQNGVLFCRKAVDSESKSTGCQGTESISLGENEHPLKELPSKILSLSSTDKTIVPNCSLPLPRRLSTRAGSPMFAPKPISPARELKLKNSIPQLMKTLPALPPDLSPLSVSRHEQSQDSMLYDFPSLLDSSAMPMKNILPDPDPQSEAHSTNATRDKRATDATESASMSIMELGGKTYEECLPLPPKLKLKMKHTSLRPPSSIDSRPWNLDESYPWGDQDPNVRLQSMMTDTSGGEFRPRFKLRVTRASLNSEENHATVRIKRLSNNKQPVDAWNSQHPKDLFTPVIRFDRIIRQVSKHFQPRKNSSNSFSTSGESLDPHLSRFGLQSPSVDGRNPDLRQEQVSEGIAGLPRSSEIRSFFSDDSSAHRRVHSLRKRLSNIRARIAAPHSNRPAASRSFDDLTWRDRNRVNIQTAPQGSRSFPNIDDSHTKPEPASTKHSEHRSEARRLKAKVSTWFKVATSAIKARLKLRSAISER